VPRHHAGLCNAASRTGGVAYQTTVCTLLFSAFYCMAFRQRRLAFLALLLVAAVYRRSRAA